MHRNDGPDALDDKFTDEIEGAPTTPASVVGASILNAFQEEIARFIESSGITLNSSTVDDAEGWGQMLPAVANYAQNGCFYFEDTGSAANDYVLKNNNLGNGTPTANPDRFTAGIFAWPIATASADGADTFITLPGLTKTIVKKLDGANPMSYDLAVGKIALCAYDPSASHFKLLGTLSGKRQYRTGIARVENKQDLSGSADDFYGPSKWGDILWQGGAWITIPLTGISGAEDIPGIALGNVPDPIDAKVESYITLPRGRYKISASMCIGLEASSTPKGPYTGQIGIEYGASVVPGRSTNIASSPSWGGGDVSVCALLDFSEQTDIKIRSRVTFRFHDEDTTASLYWAVKEAFIKTTVVECIVERYDDF